MTVADELRAGGFLPRAPLAVVAGRSGTGLAWTGRSTEVAAGIAEVTAVLAPLAPRWTWWSARETAPPLVAAGVHVRTCWDLGAVGRLTSGLRRDDPAAVWAAAQGLAEPARLAPGGVDLLDLDSPDGAPLRPDGQLSREWLRGDWAQHPRQWAELALRVQSAQEALLRGVPDPRGGPDPQVRPAAVPLAVLTAWSESAAALLAVELEHTGLPLDRAVVEGLLTAVLGARPSGEAHAAQQAAERDAEVLRLFPGPPVDLRSPAQVQSLLARAGFDLPDTRSWRLEPHAATSPAVAALLRWRRAERTSTTYGWSWLDRTVGADGRLRGAWRASDGASGRMTASAGLHNLPAELRPAVRAEPGHVLVRADLGQVEPRVLAVVSGDEGLARAAQEDDLYAPVAAALRCDRPTAKVAVLAAMYGQTSGVAGAALRGMDRAYPTAMAHLRTAEAAGVRGADLRTYGGRLLRLSAARAAAEPLGEHVALPSGAGRFARNAVVQGAAAELFKAWAATVRDGLVHLGAGAGDARIVLCLHDELLLHVPSAAAGEAAALLVDALRSTASWWAAGSAVRFVADVSVASTWASAQ